MMNKLTELTPAQRDRMASFAQEWIEYGWRTTPLTEEEWAVWEAGARKCYEFAGKPWPGVVIRVPNPMVGAFAAPFAAIAIELHRRSIAQTEKDNPAVYSAVGSAVGSAVDSAVRLAVGSAVDSAVYSAVDSAVYSAVGSAVDSAVGSAVDSAVDSAVYSAVGSAVGSAVYSAVYSAVGSAVDSAVYSAVGSAVDSAVHSAVGSAVDAAESDIKPFWHSRFGGRTWAYWPAFLAFFRDVINLQLDGDTWDRSRAYQDAESAGWWWPNKDFVMVCDVPHTMHVEAAAGQHRLHCETGPAVAWDGWGLHYWHGTQVPADIIETGWDIEQIMAEPNAEVRRCAIERMGWDRFVEAAELTLADECEDPGNPGQTLRLFDVPRKVLDLPVRVLVAHNATRERDGSRHTFGLTVPTDCRTALSAAAWTFDLTESEYRDLERAT